MNNLTWHDVFLITGSVITILLGIIIAMIGAYAKGLGKRIELLEARHTQLNNLVLSQYHNKDEIKSLLDDIKDRVEKLHSRFDLILNHTTKE